MGNNTSLPEKVFAAVQRNDVCAFQALVANFGSTASADPAARARVLEHTDKNGRTPLLVAASKNHYQILQQLIALGADIHYINPARESAGGALHEAAARRNEAAVELLLAAGASPFAANAAGRTALDEAVLSGHTGVVRAIEKFAEFAGVISFKTSSMAGLSVKFKNRWAVLMPYYPFLRDASRTASVPGSSGPSRPGGPEGFIARDVRRMRRCLWLYKDKTSVSPRCRLWVDAATVLTHGPAGTEGTLRLHTSHGEPMGDLATSYSQGYCVSMRPADLTAAATAVYHKLVTLLNGPNPGGNQRQQQQAAVSPLPSMPPAAGRPAASGGSLPPAVLAPNGSPYPMPLPPSPRPGVQPAAYYPPVPPMTMYGGGPGGGSYIAFSPHAQSPATASDRSSDQSFAYPGAAGPCAMASPLTLYQQQRLAVAAAAASSTNGGAQQPRPPEQSCVRTISEPATQPRPEQQSGQAGDGPHGRSGGNATGQVFIEQMLALPGESDEAFASRLASAISVTSGHSQQNLYPKGVEPESGASSSQPQQRPRQHTSGNADVTAPAAGVDPRRAVLPASDSLINFQSDPGSHPGSLDGHIQGARAVEQSFAPHAQQQARGAAGLLDDLDMNAVNALIAAEAAISAPPQAPSGPSASSGLAPPPPYAVSCSKASPSAPPVDPYGPSPALPPPPQPPSEPDSDCIICLNAPRQVGFLHGDSVHRCVCRDCSSRILVGAPCPLCRQPVERVLGVF